MAQTERGKRLRLELCRHTDDTRRHDHGAPLKPRRYCDECIEDEIHEAELAHEQACIERLCSRFCGKGEHPYLGEGGLWFHGRAYGYECPAGPIHEMQQEREERDAIEQL